MVDFTKNKTWAETQVIEDNADAGNMGKTAVPSVTSDIASEVTSVVKKPGASANLPVAVDSWVSTIMRNATNKFHFVATDATPPLMRAFVGKTGSSSTDFSELLHTDNTGTLEIGSAPSGLVDRVVISTTEGRINYENNTTGSAAPCNFYNPNGFVGNISTVGTSTAYNTSSDPRLKDFKDLPIDTVVNAEFNKLFSCFRTFNWKNDPDGDLVWGFDAHACVDAKLDIGNEGNGPRNLTLNDVYDITPAVFEEQEQQVVYKSGDKKGELRFNADDSPMMEIVSIEVTPEIEHKVTPAGVDQSKAVPILLAKIEQLERRLSALEGGA